MKSVRIRSFTGQYFPAFGLNTEKYGVSLHIQPKCGKITTRKTSNTDTFHAVGVKVINVQITFFIYKKVTYPNQTNGANTNNQIQLGYLV